MTYAPYCVQSSGLKATSQENFLKSVWKNNYPEARCGIVDSYFL